MMQITIDKLIAMKLSGMVEGLEEQMNSSVYNDLSFDERFSMLMRRARFRHPNACVEEIDFRAKRGIRKETVLKLAQNEWIKKHRNLIITGPTGVGKTYLACAFGISACRKGISTCYIRLPRLLQEMKVARADGSYIKLLGKMVSLFSHALYTLRNLRLAMFLVA